MCETLNRNHPIEWGRHYSYCIIFNLVFKGRKQAFVSFYKEYHFNTGKDVMHTTEKDFKYISKTNTNFSF